MRAGLLRERVTFFGEVKAQNAAGEIVKTLQPILTTRCYRQKQQSNLQLAASEEFIATTVIIQIRKNAKVKEGQTFSYQGKDYLADNVDLQTNDQTLIITGKKKNK